MIPQELLEGDIKQYCIACLTKGPHMHNLTEQVEKSYIFTKVFNVELDNYGALPQFLCSVCDIKLTATYNFQEAVRKCLAVLQEYNEKLMWVNPIEEVKEEVTEEECKIPIIEVDKSGSEEDEVQLKKPIRQKATGFKIVPSEEVDRVVEEFKNQHFKTKTCVLCGFIAATRRAISSHMAIFHKERKTNWCLECNDIFENYQEHKRTHSGKYACTFCDKKFKISHYLEHIRSHAGIFSCTICNKTFRSAAWLKKHKVIHTNVKPFSCPNCSKCFHQLNSLRYHLGTHGKFPCDICKKHYKTAEELVEHECVMEKLLSPNEVWIKTDDRIEYCNEDIEETIVIKGELMGPTDMQNFCKQCNKRVKSLTTHFKKYHAPPTVQETPKVKKLQCAYCQKSFSTSYKLKLHVQTHTGEHPYKCKYCDKRTINRSRLKDHETTHTKEKPYICNVCGKGMSQASALRTHMRQHTGRPEVCQLCNKRFCRKSELKLHLSKHMGEKPFLCTECGKTFAQRSHLTEHMVGHGEERPFQCPHCEKAFKKNILLKEHVKIHSGQKNFQCPSCPYACYKAYRLQQHMKQHNTESYGNQDLIENSP